MNRRTFCRTGASAFAWTATGGTVWERLPENPDLIAVKGGEADAMFRKGIAELGGIRTFVRPNSKVVIKPNIGWDIARTRERKRSSFSIIRATIGRAATKHPESNRRRGMPERALRQLTRPRTIKTCRFPMARN
jgi:hypothetical protein